SHKDGKPWVMRVRSQGEMDSLVRDAGFDKCTQRIDDWLTPRQSSPVEGATAARCR
ncbi:class I SAM-dependent methyltransferase family protein, partial [Escherichia coli]|nr:class I SAM-dependent methyltransferase family protein [Escherichia coli]